MQIHNSAFRKRWDGGEINSTHIIPSLNFTLEMGKIRSYGGTGGRIYKIQMSQLFRIMENK